MVSVGCYYKYYHFKYIDLHKRNMEIVKVTGICAYIDAHIHICICIYPAELLLFLLFVYTVSRQRLILFLKLVSAFLHLMVQRWDPTKNFPVYVTVTNIFKDKESFSLSGHEGVWARESVKDWRKERWN